MALLLPLAGRRQCFFVVFLPAHPASCTHNISLGCKVFNGSQDAMEMLNGNEK